MNRKQFLQTSVLAGLSVFTKSSLSGILKGAVMNSEKMPALFLGHGNPMNAIEDNAYTRGWADMVKDLKKPKAILVISAHWETRGGTQVLAAPKPKMIYDMYGFPQKLYEVKYEAPGSPELAEELVNKVTYDQIKASHDWGLDHGAWSVLVKMFPQADIPCFQLSLNYTRDLRWHYEMAKELAFLRKKGVLIVGSGNIVHNLNYFRQFNQQAPDLALEFDDYVTQNLEKGNVGALLNYKQLGRAAEISVNSAEHYIPMLYTMALRAEGEALTYANHNIDQSLMGVSMRSLRIG